MAVSSYPNALCSCATSFGCLLHGRSNRVSNECFRHVRTPAYYGDRYDRRSFGGSRYHHHDLFMYASRHVPNWVSSRVSLSALYILCRHCSTWPSSSTDRMLLRLIFISVNAGLSTALFALLFLILFLIYPTDLIYPALYLPLCTAYCNSLLANLNMRSFVRGGSERWQLNSLSLFVAEDVGSERTEV